MLVFRCGQIGSLNRFSTRLVVWLVLIVPSEIYQFDNITQLEGSPAQLTCLARGDPTPNMTLYRVNSHGKLRRLHVVRPSFYLSATDSQFTALPDVT